MEVYGLFVKDVLISLYAKREVAEKDLKERLEFIEKYPRLAEGYGLRVGSYHIETLNVQE